MSLIITGQEIADHPTPNAMIRNRVREFRLRNGIFNVIGGYMICTRSAYLDARVWTACYDASTWTGRACDRITGISS